MDVCIQVVWLWAWPYGSYIVVTVLCDHRRTRSLYSVCVCEVPFVPHANVKNSYEMMSNCACLLRVQFSKMGSDIS